MLWRSPLWEQGFSCAPIQQTAGLKYLEFIEPDDIDPLLRFFQDDSTKFHSYRCMEPGTGILCAITIAKLPWGANWLCLCKAERLAAMPAPPCVYYEKEEENEK